METPFLTPADLEAVILERKYHALPGTAVVCELVTIYKGFKIYGIAPGPMNPANHDFETGCDIAFDKAFEQLWQMVAFLRAAQETAIIAPVQGVTQDMKLPEGSAVFQIINAAVDGVPNLDMRGVLVGGGSYDPLNPAHRLLAVINNNIDQFVAMATGGTVTREPAGAIEERLAANQHGIGPDTDPDFADPVSLSKGTPFPPAQFTLATGTPEGNVESDDLLTFEERQQEKLANLALGYSTGNPTEALKANGVSEADAERLINASFTRAENGDKKE